MQLSEATITVDKYEAARQLRAYQKALQGTKETARRREDRDTMRALHVLKRGERLISLAKVFEHVEVDEFQRPKIAIARADARFVELRTGQGDRTWTFGHGEKRWDRSNAAADIRIVVPARVRPTQWKNSRAVVPVIPPWLRPAEDKLPEYFTLFEADWQTAPIDPALLKRVTTDLFVVLATWDLSPVERAVLQAARVRA